MNINETAYVNAKDALAKAEDELKNAERELSERHRSPPASKAIIRVRDAKEKVRSANISARWAGYSVCLDITDDNMTMLGNLLCNNFALRKENNELYAICQICPIQVRLTTQLDLNGQLLLENQDLVKYVKNDHDKNHQNTHKFFYDEVITQSIIKNGSLQHFNIETIEGRRYSMLYSSIFNLVANLTYTEIFSLSNKNFFCDTPAQKFYCKTCWQACIIVDKSQFLTFTAQHQHTCSTPIAQTTYTQATTGESFRANSTETMTVNATATQATQASPNLQHLHNTTLNLPMARSLETTTTEASQNLQHLHNTTLNLPTARSLELRGPPPKKIKFPNYTDAEARKKTFVNWTRTQPVSDMVNAGFFYSGNRDNAICFYCGGNLRNWEDDDIPKNEHARWFPKCQFMINTFGTDFINGVQLGIQSNMLTSPEVPSSNSQYQSDLEAALHQSLIETRAEPKTGFNDDKNTTIQSVVGMGYSILFVNAVYTYLEGSNPIISAQSISECILDMEEENYSKNADRRLKKFDYPSSEIAKAVKQLKQQNANDPHMTTTMVLQELISNFRTNKEIREFVELDIQELDLNPNAAALKMQEQSLLIKQLRTCIICEENTVNLVFLPCAHKVCCDSCGESITRCPECETHIQGTVKIFTC